MVIEGQKLLNFCSGAKGRLLLVSPFIKVEALKRILSAIPQEVDDLICVTRWHPDDIYAKVSDLEVFDLLQDRIGGKLYIHPYLHAKYFGSGRKCLVGSANITSKALGWSNPCNLEILVEEDRASFIDFETLLLNSATEATENLKKEIERIVNNMEKMNVKFSIEENCTHFGTSPNNVETKIWTPLCTRPELLFQIYFEYNIAKLIKWTLQAGQKDINALNIPAGLFHNMFNAYVSAALQQTHIANTVFNFPQNPIGTKDGQGLIQEEVGNDALVYKIEDHWKILRDWLVYFLPSLYRIPPGTDMLHKGVVIGEI